MGDGDEEEEKRAGGGRGGCWLHWLPDGGRDASVFEFLVLTRACPEENDMVLRR